MPNWLFTRVARSVFHGDVASLTRIKKYKRSSLQMLQVISSGCRACWAPQHQPASPARQALDEWQVLCVGDGSWASAQGMGSRLCPAVELQLLQHSTPRPHAHFPACIPQARSAQRDLCADCACEKLAAHQRSDDAHDHEAHQHAPNICSLAQCRLGRKGRGGGLVRAREPTVAATQAALHGNPTW